LTPPISASFSCPLRMKNPLFFRAPEPQIDFRPAPLPFFHTRAPQRKPLVPASRTYPIPNSFTPLLDPFPTPYFFQDTGITSVSPPPLSFDFPRKLDRVKCIFKFSGPIGGTPVFFRFWSVPRNFPLLRSFIPPGARVQE